MPARSEKILKRNKGDNPIVVGLKSLINEGVTFQQVKEKVERQIENAPDGRTEERELYAKALEIIRLELEQKKKP